MHIPNSFGLALLALSDSATALRKPADSVLLSSVKTLTLRDGKETSHRRVSAVPQLKCVGGNARDLYSVDVMRCKNSGSDYDDDNVQWTCQASLPEEFKLGSTDVICEGYDSASDPYVLKGSCGVEYRLVLTDKGEVKYGRLGDNAAGTPRQEMFQDLGFWLCLTFIVGVIGYAVWQMCTGRNGREPGPPRWGGGGGDGYDDGNDPPPPYTPSAPPKGGATAGQPGYQGWRPGFWTGAASGAAAGYFAGGRRSNQTNPQTDNSRWSQPSGSGSGGSGSGSSPSSSSSRYESTGFGGSSRR